MSIFKGDTDQVGLDIGTTGLRVVQAKPARGNPALVTYGAVPIETKVVQSDAAADKQQLTEAIRQLVRDSKVTTKNVVVGVPSEKTFSSLINVPKMTEQELAKSINYQAEQYVPMPIKEVKVDWLATGETDGGKQLEVMLVAAPNSLTERYLSIIEDAGLEVVAIEPDAFGLNRSLVTDQEIAVMVLDVGANNTDLVAIYQGIPRLIRSIAVGGETLVKAAAQNLNLDHEQAVQFVYKFGLTQSKLEGQVLKAIKSSVDLLVDEVEKSNKFFASRYPDVKTEKIVLTGGSSGLPELPTYLANATGLPVEIGNSWARLHYAPTAQDQLMGISNQFAVAAGLATRGML